MASEPNALTDATEPATYPEISPSAEEILGAPVLILTLLLTGLSLSVVKILWKKRPLTALAWRRQRKVDSAVRRRSTEIPETSSSQTQSEEFYTPLEREMLDDFERSYQCIGEECKILLPAVMSIILAPITMFLFTPFSTFIWPASKSSPDINDAIACYLVPSGLIYALLFGSVYNLALQRQNELTSKLAHDTRIMHRMASFASQVKCGEKHCKKDIYRCIKSEALFLLMTMMNWKPKSNKIHVVGEHKANMTTVIESLRNIKDEGDQIDRLLMTNMLDDILDINSVYSEQCYVTPKIVTPLLWVCLEILGFLSFMGVLLIQTYSYRLDLVMCFITAFSVSLLCYVVSDLDSPFYGLFKVDFNGFNKVIKRMERLYEAN